MGAMFSFVTEIHGSLMWKTFKRFAKLIWFTEHSSWLVTARVIVKLVKLSVIINVAEKKN